MTTNNTNRLPLIEAMAEAAMAAYWAEPIGDKPVENNASRRYVTAALKAALTAANRAGFVLVERGLVEEAQTAAESLAEIYNTRGDWERRDTADVLAARLRAAAGEKLS